MSRVAADLDDGKIDIVICSANGTFIDLAEEVALAQGKSSAFIYAPKGVLGESVGASAIWQTIIAAQSLRTNRLPPLLHNASKRRLRFAGRSEEPIAAHQATVLSCSVNQQVSGLKLSN